MYSNLFFKPSSVKSNLLCLPFNNNISITTNTALPLYDVFVYNNLWSIFFSVQISCQSVKGLPAIAYTIVQNVTCNINLYVQNKDCYL